MRPGRTSRRYDGEPNRDGGDRGAFNADEGVRWLFSFLSADRRQSYCLYEAPSPDELIAAARRAGIPADVIVEVNRVAPEMVA